MGISSDKDVKDKFTSSNMSALLGMGINLKLNYRWSIITGLRFAYGLTGIKGVDGLGQDLSDSALYPLLYDKYQASHTIAGGLFLRVAFNIGDVD